ncbi:hypothetical protein [Fulvimarina sp. MAC3]|uniref:hypothetical protein n=1 Tax=Fulvimarina sp. MAC3 TaxID=3148887 RepID=UPI0031FE3E26
MTSAELERILPGLHPSSYFFLANEKFEAGERNEAVRWLYVGQIRYRYHLAANPDLPPSGDPAFLASMMEVVARPINEWAGGNVETWIAEIQAALEWDAETPNYFTPKDVFSNELETVRTGLQDLITWIDEQRDQIPVLRSQNGLENEDRRRTPEPR